LVIPEPARYGNTARDVASGQVHSSAVPYNDAQDILMKRQSTEWAASASPGAKSVEPLWRIFSPIARNNSFHPYKLALDVARGYAKRTGGDIYKQIEDAIPELVERAR
jgi:hypothetical protein